MKIHKDVHLVHLDVRFNVRVIIYMNVHTNVDMNMHENVHLVQMNLNVPLNFYLILHLNV